MEVLKSKSYKENKKIKILVLVDHAIGKDGPHRNVVVSLNALCTRKKLSIILLTGEIEKNAPYAKSENIKIVLGFSPKKIDKLITNLILTIREMRNCDVVYVPTNLTSWLYALFCGGWYKKFVAGPNVTGIPILMPIYNPNKIMTTWFVQKWIENSEIRKNECLKGGTDESQIVVIPHRIDTNDFTPKKRDLEIWSKYGLDKKRLKIIHVGRADEKTKGVFELMNSFKILNHENKYDLIYVGSKGSYWVDDFLDIPGVYYFGRVYGEELRKLYASSDIFFALSSSESFWFTPLEAMSSGLPVVVSNTGAVDIMIPQSGKQGIIINVVGKEKKEFSSNVCYLAANVLEELCTNESMRCEIGKNARKHICHNFSQEKLGIDLENVFIGIN